MVNNWYCLWHSYKYVVGHDVWNINNTKTKSYLCTNLCIWDQQYVFLKFNNIAELIYSEASKIILSIYLIYVLRTRPRLRFRKYWLYTVYSTCCCMRLCISACEDMVEEWVNEAISNCCWNYDARKVWGK